MSAGNAFASFPFGTYTDTTVAVSPVRFAESPDHSNQLVLPAKRSQTFAAQSWRAFPPIPSGCSELLHKSVLNASDLLQCPRQIPVLQLSTGSRTISVDSASSSSSVRPGSLSTIIDQPCLSKVHRHRERACR
jgi:hypothetical protein